MEAETGDMSRLADTPKRQLQAGRALREKIRAGTWLNRTTGMARGVVQGNLVVLPVQHAAEFQEFCHLNPKPCPLIGITKPGDASVPALSDDIDLRTDLGGYYIFEDGTKTEEVTNICNYWRSDLVGFVLGCSNSFDDALMEGGLTVRHIENGTKVPVYMTNMPTKAAGPFYGPTIVSMRPFSPPDAIRAIEITSRLPRVHGAPVHFGDPSMIGISDITKTYYGPSPEIQPGEVPVFWACGITPQAILREARLPFAITHSPGHMLVTDKLTGEFATNMTAVL